MHTAHPSDPVKLLKEVVLENNNLHGDIPSSYHQPCRLDQLNVAASELYLLNQAFLCMVDLTCFPFFFSFSHLSDELTGQLPTELANCPNLRVLDVADNRMSGKIPNDYKELKELELFVATGNDFSGAVSNEICTLMEGDARKFIEIDCDKVECSCCNGCR